jgi:hypothetical protein
LLNALYDSIIPLFNLINVSFTYIIRTSMGLIMFNFGSITCKNCTFITTRTPIFYTFNLHL